MPNDQDIIPVAAATTKDATSWPARSNIVLQKRPADENLLPPAGAQRDGLPSHSALHVVRTCTRTGRASVGNHWYTLPGCAAYAATSMASAISLRVSSSVRPVVTHPGRSRTYAARARRHVVAFVSGHNDCRWLPRVAPVANRTVASPSSFASFLPHTSGSAAGLVPKHCRPVRRAIIKETCLPDTTLCAPPQPGWTSPRAAAFTPAGRTAPACCTP